MADALRTNAEQRYLYLQTRMVNKSAIPMLLDLINLDQLKQNSTASLNLTNLHDVMKNLRDIAEAHDNQPYIYYPYWVKPQDIGYSHLCQGLAHCHVLQSDHEQNIGIQNSYWQCNYGATPNESVTQSAVEAIPFERKDCTKERHIRQEVIHVASDSQSKLRVAIGNARVNAKDFEDILILTTDIDIQALRETQYPDIADRKSFKPLPPIFDRGYIKARYDGSLWRKLNSELERHQQEKM